ncbi:MAG: aminopeptidase P family protein [Alkalispirochaeta sp.]
MNFVKERVENLREWMATQDVDAVIVPSADPHQSEYPPEHHRTRAWISGFAGSAGTVVITNDTAGLWTDSRYFLEAERIVSTTGFQLFRLHTTGTPNHVDWITDTVPENGTIAVDMRTVTVQDVRELHRAGRRKKINVTDAGDLFDTIWKKRPSLPDSPLYLLPAETAGEGATEKITRIRRTMKEHGAATHVVGTLDDIAWILNLRGSDVPYNPVFLAYLIISNDGTTLYTDSTRVSGEIREYLASLGVAIREYQSFFADIPSLSGPTLIDPQRLSEAVASTWSEDSRVEAVQPSTAMKARKNETELNALRQAMRADGAAMVKFLRWFDERVSGEAGAGENRIDELSAAARLREFRRQIPDYIGDSFNYISGFNGNGAIVHYSADEESNADIIAPGVFLIDSGGQYRNGTTDITRTIPVGTAPAKAIRDFTLVLKGMIALATAVFPTGTSGRDIDAIARTPLWKEHLNYGHGTGHGVGFCLNVHEGPQRIAPAAQDWPLEPGMVVSDEPGLYRRDRWGIRIENLLTVIPARPPSNSGDGALRNDFGTFLAFETLTLAPIDRRMIDTELLSAAERQWLNDYHRRVRSELTDLLGDPADRQWLKNATEAV